MSILKLNVRDYFAPNSPTEKVIQESQIEQNPNTKQEKRPIDIGDYECVQ